MNEEKINTDLNNIQFCDIFVLEEIQQLQDNFSNATGVASLITYPDGTPITRPSNFCKLCNDIIRKTERGRLNCFRSDAVLGRHNPSGPIVRTCLSGDLWDAGASITVGGKHIANWLIGQVKNEHSNVWQMMKYADEIGADKEAYLKALDEIPEMSFERFNSVASVLFQFANELSEKAYSNLLLKMQILEREKVTAMLLKSEEKYRMLVENCNDIIYTIDAEGLFTFVSPVWTTLLGHPLSQVVGKSFKDFIYPEDFSLFLDFIQDSDDTQKCIQGYEYRVHHQDGSWHWHTAGCLPIRDENGIVTGYYGSTRDIGSQKLAEAEIKLKNEELLKSNTVKDKFFSIIAHDLRSPFSSILGLSQMMAEDLSDFTMDQIQHIASNIHNTADNLFRLLENLLQWAKIQQNLISVDLKNMALLPVFMESLSLFKESVQSKNIEIVIVIPENLQVNADTNMLKTILRNLISNAVKFTPKGGKMEIAAKETKGNHVIISVKDSGIGMGPKILENLFSPDIKTGRKGTENEPGTGFGLLLCKEFVERLGGEIYAESEQGKGSTFYFTVRSIFSEAVVE